MLLYFAVFQDIGTFDPNLWQAEWYILPRSSVLKTKTATEDAASLQKLSLHAERTFKTRGCTSDMYTYLMYNICKKRPFIIWKCQIKREIVGVDISCFLIDLEVRCFVMNILISCLLCIWFIWSNWNCFCCYTSVYSTL